MTEAQSNHDLQGALLHFAVEELVRHQREEFPPLWTRESWAKFLIWVALQCGAPLHGTMRRWPPPVHTVSHSGAALMLVFVWNMG